MPFLPEPEPVDVDRLKRLTEFARMLGYEVNVMNVEASHFPPRLTLTLEQNCAGRADDRAITLAEAEVMTERISTWTRTLLSEGPSAPVRSAGPPDRE